MLGGPGRAAFDHPSSILYFHVDDLDSSYAGRAERGVVFTDRPHLVATMPDHKPWMAFFTDSEGKTLALMNKVRPA